VDNHATHAYFQGAFGRGATRGAATVGLTALSLPNMATWVLYPSMGSCVAVSHAGLATGAVDAHACLLSYAGFPSGSGLTAWLTGASGASGTAATGTVTARPSAVYDLFGLAPLAAVLIGGWFAASRTGLRGPARSAAVGAAAGVVFAAWSVALVILARIVLGISGSGATAVGGEQALALGPAVAVSVALSLAWGVIGGATGAALQGLLAARRAPRVRERVFPHVPSPASATDPARAPSAAPPESAANSPV